jgi:hypothetical protein
MNCSHRVALILVALGSLGGGLAVAQARQQFNHVDCAGHTGRVERHIRRLRNGRYRVAVRSGGKLRATVHRRLR